MKETTLITGRWILAGLLVLLLAVFMLSGLGKRRGTGLYRFRMKLWSALFALTAGTGFFLGSMAAGCNTKKAGPPEAGLSQEAAADAAADVSGETGEAEAVETAEEAGDRSEPADAQSEVLEKPPENVVAEADEPAVKKGTKARIKKTLCYAIKIESEDEKGYKETVRKVVKQHMKEIKACYENQLASHPDLEGRIEVRFAVNEQGVVTNAKVEKDTVKNKALADCVVNAMKRWAFPSHHAGLILLTYPFVFSPKE